MLKKILTLTILAAAIAGCVGGGSSGTTDNNGGGNNNGGGSNNGGTPTATITKLKVLDSTTNTNYSPTCLYSHGGVTYIVKADGSGNGVSINVNNGTIKDETYLPKVDMKSGDVCLDNFGQLTWYNSSNTSVIKVMDPDNGSNANVKTIDLSTTGVSGSEISNTSYSLGQGTLLFANNTFLNNGYIGFSDLSLDDLPNTHFTPLDYSNYQRTGDKPLYGFNGVGVNFIQLLKADGEGLPALEISVINVPGSSPIQTIRSITDTNGNAIAAMSTAWDFTNSGKSVIVVTGAVQPVIYNCPVSADPHNFQCDKSYTNSELTSKYRIMRVLGANNSILYFMGMDVANAEIDIFAMQM